MINTLGRHTLKQGRTSRMVPFPVPPHTRTGIAYIAMYPNILHMIAIEDFSPKNCVLLI